MGPGPGIVRRGKARGERLRAWRGQRRQLAAHGVGELSERPRPACLQGADPVARIAQRQDGAGDAGLANQEAVIACGPAGWPPDLGVPLHGPQRQGRDVRRDATPPGGLSRPESGLAGQFHAAVRGQHPDGDGLGALGCQRLGQQRLGEAGRVAGHRHRHVRAGRRPARRAWQHRHPLPGDVGGDAGRVRPGLGGQPGQLHPGLFRRAAEPLHEDPGGAFGDGAGGELRAQLGQLTAQLS